MGRINRESPVFGGIIAAYEGSAFTILCIMVGIFAPLNGEPRSDFPMRFCDLLHNHSCQLAHYGFCPKPLSDVRRALLSLSCLMKESSLSLSPPRARWGERAVLGLEREPLADFGRRRCFNKDLNPHPLTFSPPPSPLILCY